MAVKSLNWAIVATLAAGLAVPAIAEKTKTKSNQPNDRVQGTFSDGCSITSTTDSVAVDVHLSNLWSDGSDEATVALTVNASAKGGPLIATYDLKTAKGRMAGGGPSQVCDNAPPAQDHAINTKGAGAEKKAQIVHKDVATCTVSGDLSKPAVSVHVVLPQPSGKATFKEFTVTKKTDVAARAGTQSDTDPNMMLCSTESGQPSAVAVKASWDLKANVK